MKKLIFLLSFVLLAVAAMAQERTVVLNSGSVVDLNTKKLVAYNGTAADYLIPTTRDTIDYVLLIDNQSGDPLNFYANITLTPISGADTTVSVGVYYKMFESQSYTQLIAPALTSAITTSTQVVKTTLGVTNQITNTTASAVDLLRQTIIANNDTITVATRTQTSLNNVALYYRYLKFRLILTGNDSVGTGIKVSRIEIKLVN